MIGFGTLPVYGAASMRHLILSFAALALLASCSGNSDHKALVSACTADGESAETCSCIADAMEAKLDPDLFKRTAQMIGREKRDVESFVTSLSGEEQLQFASVVNDMFTCKLSRPKG
tara:strand:+ start:1833 stop:2183 length:351 start_codon:yes stop_codon:yes gene_type:complete